MDAESVSASVIEAHLPLVLARVAAKYAQFAGACVATLVGHTSWILSVAVLPDGQVVTGSSDHTVRVHASTPPCECVELMSDTWMLPPPTVSRDDVHGGLRGVRGVHVAHLLAHPHLNSSGGVSCVTALPDGRILVKSQVAVTIWSAGAMATGERIRDDLTPALALVAAAAANGQGQLHIHGRNVCFFGAAADDFAYVPVTTFLGMRGMIACAAALPVTCAAALPDGRIVTCQNTVAIIWSVVDDASTNPPTWASTDILSAHTDLVACVAVLPDGRLVTGSHDKTARVWTEDSSTGEWTVTATPLSGHGSEVLCVAVLPDGMRVVTGSQDAIVRICNVDTGNCDMALAGHTGPVSCVAATRDGRIVTGSHDKTARVWH
jgi:WD40 repeat protein